MGDYGNTKSYYKQTMDCHEQHNIPVASVRSPFSIDNLHTEAGGVDEALQSHLDALENYHAMVEGGTGRGSGRGSNSLFDGTSIGGDSSYIYQRDYGYEGDLHSTLGALYLSRDEAKRARGHLENAIALYESEDKSRMHGGKSNARSLADVKFNLAMALYRLRHFSVSTKIQFEALDMYQDLYGPGLNPLVQRLEEYEQALSAALDMEEGLAGSDSDDQRGESVAKEGRKDKERQIDLDRYRQMVVNATAAATQGTTPEEEL